jgi:hypothetical protein
MKNLTFALVAAAAFMAFGASPVQAGATCKLVPSLCPPPPGGGGASDVPEPATFAVLALGACAAGLAARRRKK